MLLSLNWLKDYFVKTDVKLDPDELAHRLTMRGFPVAAIQRTTNSSLPNVVVGRIDVIEKHPNADRLQVTKVTTSEEAGAQQLQIVCGATNIAVGDIVPVALVGAILPGDFAIKQSAIRGVDSYGMLCSGKELGVSDAADGILQLPKTAPLGEAVVRLLGGQSQEDVVLDLEVTPNRPDCLSYLGVAREIAPMLKTKVRDPKPARFRVSAHRTSSIIKVEVEDPEVCPRYVARVIDGLKVTESPDWIKQRLQTAGIRSVNNIVDVTNLVMLEYGQPLHAFDLRKIQSGTVRVARCKEPTDLTLLDEQTARLEEGDILILDGDRPIALAGIMGASNSQIQPDTTSIVLESASFLPSQIRRTAKRLNIQSDAAKRFEKGVDLASVAAASERAAALLRDSFNGNVYHPPIDTNEYGVKEPILPIDMRDIRRATGLKNLSSETVGDLLESIGISSHKKSINVLAVRLPSFRLDLKETADIVEEVARLIGYDTIPETFPQPVSAYERQDESQYELEREIRRLCSNFGLREALHYSFTSEAKLRRRGAWNDKAVILQNPLSEEMRVMRTSLLPSLLDTYLFNKNRRVMDQRLFELAKTYIHDDSEETKVKETTHLAGLFCGHQTSRFWHGNPPNVDFYFAKGFVELVVHQLTTVYLGYEPLKNHALFHPARSAVLKLGLREVGVVGEIHPFILQNELETQEPIVAFELNIDALRRYERSGIRYKIPSRFPSIEIDLAFVLNKETPGNLVLDVVKHSSGALLQELSIFDVYEGEAVPAGKRSIGFRLTFGSNDKTLQEQEITELKNRIVQTLQEKYGAQLRS